MSNRPILLLSLIALISFIILCSVQFFLVYNTYELKNEHFNPECAFCLDSAYEKSIRDDKVFPGGGRIIDDYIYRNIDTLEKANASNTAQFNQLRFRLVDSIFRALRRSNNLDSVLAPLLNGKRGGSALDYTIIIFALDIDFHGEQYIPLYRARELNPYYPASAQSPEGASIGGTLQTPSPHNHITFLTVSSGNDRSYRITFNLFADTKDRCMAIIRLMMPTFLLSLLSIVSVLLIYFLTFRNWIRQKKLSEMKSDFINGITHEFHTPLSTILIANKTLQSHPVQSSPEYIMPLTDVIGRQAERLKLLIGTVLDITSMNKIVPDKKTLSIHALLDEILLDYRLKQTNGDFQLTFDKDAEMDTVLVDPFWFTSIIINILDNAVKYGDKEMKEVAVTTRNSRKHLIVSITDNGPGMDAHTQKQAFEKFFRGEAHTDETKGLGLGLYYVWLAIRAHHWKIEIESAKGKGTTFHITIPLLLS